MINAKETMMIYRFKQLYNALFTKIEPDEYQWLSKILAPAELVLFRKQALPEQRHALDVAYDIMSRQEEIVKTYNLEIFENLLLAALLHDCGKALVKLQLWQRIIIVAFSCLPPGLWHKIARQKNILGKTSINLSKASRLGETLNSEGRSAGRSSNSNSKSSFPHQFCGAAPLSGG
jgi:hypothetical protein